MPNSNYIKGRKKEYRVMNEERKKGNLVLRSAGSHSKIDIVCIDVRGRIIKFIQCKPDDTTDLEKNKLELEMRKLNNVFRCEFVVR
jgi:Holliday junction resolvase